MKRYMEYYDPKDIVQARRSELSLTHTELAKLLGYKNPNFISILEKGKSKVPLNMAPVFAEVLEMDAKWFISRCMRETFPAAANAVFGPDQGASSYWQKIQAEELAEKASRSAPSKKLEVVAEPT